MREGENCGFCRSVLEAHCDLHGKQNPKFCELKERYYTDPTMGTDQVFDSLEQMATPDQISQATEHVDNRIRRGLPPPPMPEPPAAQAAADRWLHNWQNGG